MFVNGFWEETRTCTSIFTTFLFQLEVLLQPKDFMFQKFQEKRKKNKEKTNPNSITS